jgi:hypothetical protein
MSKAKDKEQKKEYRVREARLTIDCTAEQKKRIKLIAAAQDMTITDFVLKAVEEKIAWCPIGRSHIPNDETVASIEASERGEGVKSFQSLDELFKDLGI